MNVSAARRAWSRWKLRACASLGPGVVAYGRVWVHGQGETHIGPGAVLDGRSAPIEIRPEAGAAIHVGSGAILEGGTSLDAQIGITVGAGARVGRFVKVMDSHFHPLRRDGSGPPPPLAVTIGPGAVVEEGAIVMRGAQIEAGAHVLEGAVVSRRVPSGASFPPAASARAPLPKPDAPAVSARPAARLRVPAFWEARSIDASVIAILRARLLFRGCRRGVRDRALGYVRVVRDGKITLGDRVTFAGGMVPTEVVTHDGGAFEMGASTNVNYGSSFEAFRSVRIGARCWIASFVRISDRGWQGTAPVTVGDEVWIAHGVTIEPGVTVGDGSVIAAGSVVTQDVPSNSLAIGNPARCMSLEVVAPAEGARRAVGNG